MQKVISIIFLLVTTVVLSQQTITKTVKSNAPYVEIKTEGIDNLIIQESDSNILEMKIIDADGLGFVEGFSCSKGSCVLDIKTEMVIENPQTNKVDMFPIKAPTNVSAIVKIPKDKKVTIFGETIDIQTHGYKGVLMIFIDKGNVRLNGIKGIVEVNLFAGNVFATVHQNDLNLRTRKGIITHNKEIISSPLRKRRKTDQKLIVKSINANIVLTEQEN